jgi:hypothetical protein
MTATLPVVLDVSGNRQLVVGVMSVDASGNYTSGGGKQESFTLADSKSAAGDYPNGTPGANAVGVSVYGGDYVWTVFGTLGSGGSAALKTVSRNASGAIVGTQTLATKTTADTAGGTGVGLGSNAEVYVTLAGSALSGVTVVLSRLP